MVSGADFETVSRDDVLIAARVVKGGKGSMWRRGVSYDSSHRQDDGALTM